MESYLAQIMMFGANWAPRSWANCQGQLLPISSNTALFSIIGTIYGGDGRTTFALPNMQSVAPVGQGRGPGLSVRAVGQRGGQETVTLNQLELPTHTHTATTNNLQVSMPASSGDGSSDDPSGRVMAKTVITAGGRAGEGKVYADSGSQQMAPGAVAGNVGIGQTGGSQPHNNMQPWLGMNFIICIAGIYPSRN